MEARKARTGHQRARGLVIKHRVSLRADVIAIRQLLVTLAIFQALTNECRRDVSLLTKGLLVSVKEALQCLPDDLEVQARAASAVCADVIWVRDISVSRVFEKVHRICDIYRWSICRNRFKGNDRIHVMPSDFLYALHSRWQGLRTGQQV